MQKDELPENSLWEPAVPVMNSVFAADRETAYSQLLQAGAGMVLVCLEWRFDPEAISRGLGLLAQNLQWLKERGMPAGVWINSFGFGTPLHGADAEAARGFTQIRSIGGRTCGDAFCPAGPAYRNWYCALVRRIVRAGARLLLLDDDLCLSVRPGLGCACARHRAMYRRRLGRPVRRAELAELVYSGAPGPERRLWLELMGETLVEFCRAVRAAADAEAPGVRIGLCAGYTSWDLEGVDALTLARVLAGSGRPLLRLSAAPYWVYTRRFPGQTLAGIVEFARLQQSWCAGSGVQLFSENDSYPRPRTLVPAALLQAYSFCLAASGVREELKYLMDYDSSPGYETGYLEAHCAGQPLLRRVGALLGPWPALGVYVHEPMRKIADSLLPVPFAGEGRVMRTAFSSAAELFSQNGVPVSYEAGGPVAAAFGEAARSLRPAGFRGLILDVPACLLLQANGEDAGLEAVEKEVEPSAECFVRPAERVRLWRTQGRCFGLRLRPDAQVESWFETPDGPVPASYTYCSAAGRRFLVFAFEGFGMGQQDDLFSSYCRQRQLQETLARMGSPLPAVSPKHPGLYLLCKAVPGGLGLAVCNMSLDAIQNPVFTLEKTYAAAHFMGCRGRLEGQVLTFSSPLPAYGFAAVILKEKPVRAPKTKA